MFGRQRKALKEAKEKEAWKKQIDKQVEINKIQSGRNSLEEAQKQFQQSLQKTMNKGVPQYGTGSGIWQSGTASSTTPIPTNITSQPGSISYYGQTYVPEPQYKITLGAPKVWAVVKIEADGNGYNVAMFSSEQLADVYIKKLDMYNDKTEDCYYEVEEFIIDSNIEEAKDVLPLQPEQ